MFWPRGTRKIAPSALCAASVLAAPQVAAAGGGTPYAGDFGQAIATLVIFVLLLWVLGRYAWRPVVAMLRRREEDLQAKVAAAEKRQVEADEMQQEYQDNLRELENRTEKMLQDSRREAEAEKSVLLDEARTEARQNMLRATADIAVAQNQAMVELRTATAQMAADIARQVLRDNLSEADHRSLVEQATAQIAHRVEGRS